MMHIASHISLVFIWTLTLLVPSEQVYYEPSGTFSDLQYHAKISASSRCSQCLNGCVNTKQAPNSYTQIAVNANCKVSKVSLPSVPASTKDQFMSVNATSNDTCTRNTSVSGSASEGYTLTVWVRVSQQSGTSTLFSIGNINFGLDGSQLSINNEKFQTLQQDKWYLITYRYENGGGFSIVLVKNLESVYQSFTLTPQFPSSVTSISFSPSLSSGQLYIGDLRFYKDYLTQRDIKKIYDTNYKSNIGTSECRCPKFYPDLVPNDPEGLLCRSSNGSTTLRLKHQSYFPVFAIDKNNSTAWRSKTSNTPNEMLTITFGQTYMIESISIRNTGSIPANISIELIRDGESYRQDFPSPALINQVFTWTLRNASRLPASSTVADVEKLIARAIQITLKGHQNNMGYYEVPEIQVTGRCYCSGLSENCQRNTDSRTFRCLNCIGSQGDSCQTCNQGFYRKQNSFQCDTKCICHSPGTQNDPTVCDQNGGQCMCKSNVTGQNCDTCEDLYYNLTSGNPNGCQKCNCDVFGTASCDKTTGACTCKPNVQVNVQNSPCSKCIPQYYGRQNTGGCVACNCESRGTNNASCDEMTGQCKCKTNVQGRTCNTCKDEFYKLDKHMPEGCTPCSCNVEGSVNNVCDKVSGQCRCKAGVDITANALCSGNRCQKCNQITNAKLQPNFGPVAGGTKVTLKGYFFGSSTMNTRVSIGTKPYHTVDKVNDTYLEFTTDNYTLGMTEVVIQWTNQSFPGREGPDFVLRNFTFEFKSNPQVNKVSNATAFKSGGCSVLIQGTGLDSVANTKLIIYSSATKREIDRTSCIYSSVTSNLRCKSPKLANVGMVTYGLYLDGMTMYQNLSTFKSNNIKIVADPVVNKVQGDKEFKTVFSSTFLIRGDSLNAACADEDFSVDCGQDITCVVLSRSSSRIECKPDISFPGISRKVQLKLKIGDTVYEAQEIEFVVFWSTMEFILIAVGAAVFLLLIIGVIVLVRCCCSRRVHSNTSDFNKLKADTKDRDSPIHLLNLNGKTTDDNEIPIMERQPARPNSYEGVKLDKENWQTFLHLLNESVRKQVDFSHTDMTDIEPGRRCINKGDQIRVIDGKFKAGTSNFLAGRSCILKTMVNEYSSFESALLPQWVSNGIQECLKFRDCDHDNFLHIKGVATDEKRFYVIYPSFHRIFKDYLNDKAIQNPIRDLLQFSLQISDGVQYLHENNIVHKDLATRNCVIDENNIVKVSDAAFSWNLYPNDYMYDERRERFLPIRWMALESLTSGFYDSASDIWTLGVLIWEIMYEANSLPYPDVLDDKDIKDHVSNGFRLGKSNETPEQLYTLMLGCWENSSENRVKIETIIDTLSKMVDPDNFGQSGLYINEDETVELYQNTSFENPAFNQ